MLKIKDPQAFDLLNKLSTASGTKQFDWTKLPTNSQWSSIKSLESLELIFTGSMHIWKLQPLRRKD